jgi:hypothetical protein
VLDDIGLKLYTEKECNSEVPEVDDSPLLIKKSYSKDFLVE